MAVTRTRTLGPWHLWLLFAVIALAGPIDAAVTLGSTLEGAPSLRGSAPKPAGSVQGTHRISEQTGAATYQYAISLPPGRRSMAPTLAHTNGTGKPVSWLA